MDRTYFSDPAVVTAARQYVCVRLATYEDPAEVKYLSRLIPTRSGQLENSGFAVFAPDGTTKLGRPGRGPRYGSAAEFADQLNQWAKDFDAKGNDYRLPKIANLKLAITIAAADTLPLVIVRDEKALELVNKLAWQDQFRGQFLFVVVKPEESLKAITKADPEAAVLVVQSETFGRTAELLSSVRSATEPGLKEAFQTALKKFVKEDKRTRSHVAAGAQAGVFYEPPTPVTDPMEIQARERTRKK